MAGEMTADLGAAGSNGVRVVGRAGVTSPSLWAVDADVWADTETGWPETVCLSVNDASSPEFWAHVLIPVAALRRLLAEAEPADLAALAAREAELQGELDVVRARLAGRAAATVPAGWDHA